MRLALKYPDLFSSVVAFAGGYRQPEELDVNPHPSYAEMFNNDKEIFRKHHPETWARRNAGKVRGKLAIQIYVGNQDPGLAGNRHIHALLDELEIPHGYQEFEGVAHKIDLRLRPAIETLDALVAERRAGAFDFAFIDADKENYLTYYERCLELVRPGGLIAIDNILWHGNVIDRTKQDADTQAIRAFNDRVSRDDRVWISLLPISDGLTLALKKQ